MQYNNYRTGKSDFHAIFLLVRIRELFYINMSKLKTGHRVGNPLFNTLNSLDLNANFASSPAKTGIRPNIGLVSLIRTKKKNSPKNFSFALQSDPIILEGVQTLRFMS